MKRTLMALALYCALAVTLVAQVGQIPGPTSTVYATCSGCTYDAKKFAAGAMTSSSTTLTDTTNNPFVAGDVNKIIEVDGAAPGDIRPKRLSGDGWCVE
jgi:hypothetical protein